MSDQAALLRQLQQAAFFAGLDTACLEQVAGAVTRCRVPAGRCLLRQGESGDALFVVLHGRFAAEFAERDGRERRVGEIGPGETLGEMAMLSDEVRATTVRALRDSEVVQLPRLAFETLAAAHPELMRRLASRLARRLRDANRHAPPRAVRRTFTLLPHRAAPGLDDFAVALSQALASQGEVLIVTRGSVAALWPDETADPTPLLAWLAGREDEGARLLYLTEPGAEAWNRLCLAQADTLLLVAAAAEDPAPGAVEALIPPDLPAHRELILLHEPGTTPTGTRHWLAPGRFHRHHHVRRGEGGDIARVARWVSGRAVGLALGGGGARAFAHIGVIRALEEAGIPIDGVGGTSMGSIVAGELAQGWTWRAMISRTRRAFRTDPMKRDNTLPLLSLITCRPVVRLLQELFETRRIEDGWLPFFCMATSLTRAVSVTRRDGLFWQRIRESGALPGIAPPVIADGEFIVDGAVLNNLPADIMLAEGMGTVIAVNVSPREDLHTDWDDTHHLSGWRVLWSRLRGGRTPLPSMLWVLQRTVLLNSVASADHLRDRVALYLEPPVEEYGLFDWLRIDDIAECGYRHAAVAIREWQGVRPE